MNETTFFVLLILMMSFSKYSRLYNPTKFHGMSLTVGGLTLDILLAHLSLNILFIVYQMFVEFKIKFKLNMTMRKYKDQRIRRVLALGRNHPRRKQRLNELIKKD